MIVKILGSLDIVIGILFWITGVFQILPGGLMLILGLILIAKGIAFAYNFNLASMIDIGCGFIIIIGSTIVIPKIIVIVVTIYLIQKGIFSLSS